MNGLIELYKFAMDFSMFSTILWWIAIPATIFLLIFSVIGLFGGDADQAGADVDDFDADGADDGPGFSMISFKSLLAFLTMFGWVPLLMLKMGYSEWISALWGVISGFGMMVFVSFIFWGVSKLETKNSPKSITAIGHIGTVLLRIPAGENMGKIQVEHNGALRTYDAVASEELKQGVSVKIVDVVNNVFTVEKA